MTRPTLMLDAIDAAVDHVLDHIDGPIVLGAPLGIGKPNPFINALYRRVKALPERRLRIITALSLEKPVGNSDLERHFLEPLVERVFGDYPDLDYVKDSRGAGLPPNIEVHEVFMKTGDYLGNSAAQQDYISSNYTHIARDMAVQGMNVLAQAVAAREDSQGMRLSLSSNPDVIFEGIEKFKALGLPLMVVGVVNRKLPFMPNTAEVGPEFFDVVVTDPAATHALFAPPNNKVGVVDYAIGLHAASLVVDDGTLQIGIGSLGDSIAQGLIVRDRHGDEFRQILASLCPDGIAGRETARFDKGLYGCSEMFVNGFLKLIEAGIIRREVFGDAVLQQMLNQGVATELVTPAMLRGLLDRRRIRGRLDAEDLAFLQRFGVLRPEVRLDGAELAMGSIRVLNDLRDPAAFETIATQMLGTRLAHGIFMTGGFFLGPNDFYERLRTMPPQELAKIDMTRIDFINQLYGDEALKRAQRRKARFMNTTMIVSLLGAAASDALESGQVVSGVGGQYNFVAQAFALEGARALLALEATRFAGRKVASNIRWSYGHETIPRHLRDVFITEYGVADVRGKSDAEVIAAMLAIADSRFQDELVRQAKDAGKLPKGHEIPAVHRENFPERIAAALKPAREAGLLPSFPFGSDFTEVERRLIPALQLLQAAQRTPAQLPGLLWEGLTRTPDAGDEQCLARLGLDRPGTLAERFYRALVSAALARTK